MPPPAKPPWPRPPHTAAKHEILRAYLGAWFGKLAWSGRLLFVDGFAGPGLYENDQEGSPLIALRLANEHVAFQPGRPSANCERLLLFVERDPTVCEYLQQQIDEMGTANNVDVEVVQNEFEPTFQAALDSLGDRQLAPAFVMVDPFGWTGFPYRLIERLGRYGRSEILVSFMSESINRFLEHQGQADNWDELFGTPSWRTIPRSGSPAERHGALLAFYRARLEAAGFKFQWQFELRDDGNRTEYFLVFGSHSRKGLAAMKTAMWQVAPDGSFMFSDYEHGAGQARLLLGDPPSFLRNRLLANYPRGTRVHKSTLWEFTIDSTDYIDTHLNAALRDMEGYDVEIERPPGRRRNFLKDVWVTFS